MHILVNGLGASAGAGLTYLYNVVPKLSQYASVRTTLAVQSQLRGHFQRCPNVTLISTNVPAGAGRRFWFEQRHLPALIRESGADVLISTGNFAVRNSPVPQILLSGNSLYTSSDFSRDLRSRHAYGMWLDTRLKAIMARKSIRWAQYTVAPSFAYAEELRRWSTGRVTAIHHGFDASRFFADQAPLAGHIQNQLQQTADCLRLLFVSHYNYYRNFETLFRGIALLRDKCPARKVRLFLTCELSEGKNPGSYSTRRASKLIRELGIRNEIVELGAVSYQLLHQLYQACHIYVTAAYTETFAHPLVEAMACGLPVVASDLKVHREICADRAVYFPAFSPEKLAERIAEAARSAGNQPLQPSPVRFSWDDHVKAIIALAEDLTQGSENTGRVLRAAV